MPQGIWRWISNISTAWGLLPSSIATYLIAAFWVAAMAVAGYIEQIPLFWILLGLPLAAASIITLALRSAEWRARVTASNKLLFHGVQISGDYQKDAGGNVTAITNAQVRLLLQSTATFPISFIVDEFQSSFEGEFSPNKPRDNEGGTALAHEIKIFSDHRIDMKNKSIKEIVEGTVKFKIRYGHKNREKYVISHDQRFYAKFDPKLGVYVVIIQQDIS